MLGISSSFIIFLLFIYFGQLTAVLFGISEFVCAPGVALFISRLIFLCTHKPYTLACSICLHVLAHNALHHFNVLLLLLPNGPHGSFPPYDFGPLLTQDHPLLPLLVVRISTYLPSHKSCPFPDVSLGSTLFFLCG